MILYTKVKRSKQKSSKSHFKRKYQKSTESNKLLLLRISVSSVHNINKQAEQSFQGEIKHFLHYSSPLWFRKSMYRSCTSIGMLMECLECLSEEKRCKNTFFLYWCAVMEIHLYDLTSRLIGMWEWERWWHTVSSDVHSLTDPENTCWNRETRNIDPYEKKIKQSTGKSELVGPFSHFRISFLYNSFVG